MNTGQIAKNLLAERNCDNCTHCVDNDFVVGGICRKNSLDLPGESIPEENTCLEWKEGFRLEIKMTSIPITVKARKLKIKWTKDVE